MTIQDILALLSNPLFFPCITLGICVGLGYFAGWNRGHNAGMIEALRTVWRVEVPPSVTHPADYYGDPWTEGMTPEPKENRIDTV